jgi:cell division protease FtsH
MAAALLEWETIDADQIEDIMQGLPPRPPKATGGGSPVLPSSQPPVSPSAIAPA